jgi:hypothetical protein
VKFILVLKFQAFIFSDNTVNTEIDDEDELLYGESAPNLFEKAANETKDTDNGSSNMAWKR